MKTGNWLRVLGVSMLLGSLPVIASADEFAAADINKISGAMLVDSLPKAKKQDDKDSKKSSDKNKDSKKGADADKGKDPKVVDIDPKKPNIKEIPKARPKLRPGTVTDRIKIKRPPVRVKPGKGLRVGL